MEIVSAFGALRTSWSRRLASGGVFDGKAEALLKAVARWDARAMWSGAPEYRDAAGAGSDGEAGIAVIVEKDGFAGPRRLPILVGKIQQSDIGPARGAVEVGIGGIAVNDAVDVGAVTGLIFIGEQTGNGAI